MDMNIYYGKIENFLTYILVFFLGILAILFVFSCFYIIYKLIVMIIAYLFKQDIKFVNKKLTFLPIPVDKNYNLVTRFWSWFFSFKKWNEGNTYVVIVENNGDETTYLINRTRKEIDSNIIKYGNKTIQLVYPPVNDKRRNLPIYRINPQLSRNLKINYNEGIDIKDNLNLPPESLTALIDGNFLTKLLNLGNVSFAQIVLYMGLGISAYVIAQPLISAIAIRIISGGNQ